VLKCITKQAGQYRFHGNILTEIPKPSQIQQNGSYGFYCFSQKYVFTE